MIFALLLVEAIVFSRSMSMLYWMGMTTSLKVQAHSHNELSVEFVCLYHFFSVLIFCIWSCMRIHRVCTILFWAISLFSLLAPLPKPELFHLGSECARPAYCLFSFCLWEMICNNKDWSQPLKRNPDLDTIMLPPAVSTYCSPLYTNMCRILIFNIMA